MYIKAGIYRKHILSEKLVYALRTVVLNVQLQLQDNLAAHCSLLI